MLAEELAEGARDQGQNAQVGHDEREVADGEVTRCEATPAATRRSAPVPRSAALVATDQTSWPKTWSRTVALRRSSFSARR